MIKNIFSLLVVYLLFHPNAYADMNRVYHPYVEQQERELEYGFVWRDLDGNPMLLQRAGIGYAWSERLFTEIYVLNESVTHEGERIRGYEVELKWQLTEQGEYWADWGVLIEAGTADDIDRHEFAAGLLWEKELSGRWVAAANLLLEYEFGSDIDNEIESALRTQIRYRKSSAFEPAMEIYLDDQDWAAGPAVMGAQPLGAGKQMRWELGLLFGMDSETPASSLRASIEFEF